MTDDTTTPAGTEAGTGAGTDAGTDAGRTLLDGAAVAALDGLGDWRYILASLRARFRTPDFASALALVGDIGAAAEEMDHHPDLELRWGQVDVTTWSHDAGGVTERDVRLARRVSELAAARGATAQPAQLSALELALDTPDHEQVLPFWETVLGYAKKSGDDIVDKSGTRPTIWFQVTEPGEPGSEPTGDPGAGSGQSAPVQRWHLDLWIPPEEVQPRIEAALAAGGELVSDAQAPSYWILADPQGNKVCLCTWQNRQG